ncbi:MAG TPA: phosphatidylglycerol lysyltransferase [Spirochaetia bacterium]|nr:phosphatidylglycerol lysyltransferase [Spirochaetia bacterium]
MAVVLDPATGLTIGDADADILRDAETSDSFGPDNRVRFVDRVRASFDSFILSVSGFRKVCAFDGDEESFSPLVSLEDKILMAAFAQSFVDQIRSEASRGNQEAQPATLCLALGIDARPTGPAIAEAIIRALSGPDISLRYLFITAAPEIMAYAHSDGTVDGFIYVSASHNPVGHNGIKFGLNRGGVLEPGKAEELISRVRMQFGAPESAWQAIQRTASQIRAATAENVELQFAAVPGWKRKASDAYSDFTRIVVTGSENDEVQRSRLADLRDSVSRRPVGVLGELNGSARSTAIDRKFLEDCGVRVALLNETPGQIVHRIVPEGASLETARRELERLARNDDAYLLGYVPDNDGDRGNLVYYDRGAGRAEILSAQQVFALTCVAELAWLVYTGDITYDDRGKAKQKVAIAVNGPTSLRIDRIAEAFDAHVFRAEVGEANVVELARRLRKRGYIVRILGEGSNGGNITFPAAVRDPLNTVLAMVKLLALDTRDGRPGLFDIWCRRSQTVRPQSQWFDLGTVLSTLPVFVTTNAFDSRALLKIRSTSHGVLKSQYEKIFAAEWPARKDELHRMFGINSWKEINYDGVEEKQGVGKAFRTPPERGGFKIVFKDKKGRIVAFIWMRGSGTEPVFRVMADVESGDPTHEAYLLDWHVSMIEKADSDNFSEPASIGTQAGPKRAVEVERPT